MKKLSVVAVASLILGFTFTTAHAQPGRSPGPNFDAAMTKLFGDNTAFSANMEIHAPQGAGSEVVMPGKIWFLDGKVRFEMDMSKMLGGRMNPQTAERMKQMGMSTMVNITRPDKKLTYMIYPDMKAYVENPSHETLAGAPEDFKTEVSKIGDESAEGHDCVKNKVVVTGKDGVGHESTVWNAKDMKKFPVKIETKSQRGSDVVMLFKDVKLDKPDASQFEAPSDFTKYPDIMSLMTSRARRPPPQ